MAGGGGWLSMGNQGCPHQGLGSCLGGKGHSHLLGSKGTEEGSEEGLEGGSTCHKKKRA